MTPKSPGCRPVEVVSLPDNEIVTPAVPPPFSITPKGELSVPCNTMLSIGSVERLKVVRPSKPPFPSEVNSAAVRTSGEPVMKSTVTLVILNVRRLLV